MSLKGNTNEERIVNYLLGKGLSLAGAAGLVDNLHFESGLRPDNLENGYEGALGYTDSTYTADVDSGAYTNFVHDCAGYGLAQWTFYTGIFSIEVSSSQMTVACLCQVDIKLASILTQLS